MESMKFFFEIQKFRAISRSEDDKNIFKLEFFQHKVPNQDSQNEPFQFHC